MKILLDNCTPRPLSRHLSEHAVKHCFEMGWAQLSNGVLLTAAEQDGFDLMITCDRNLGYQQNLRGRKIAILVLNVQQWPRLKPLVSQIAQVVNSMLPGEYREL